MPFTVFSTGIPFTVILGWVLKKAIIFSGFAISIAKVLWFVQAKVYSEKKINENLSGALQRLN